MIFKRYQARIAELLRLAIKHDGLRKYGANTIWLFAEKFFRILLGFTVGIYVARQLGPAQYGLLNYALSYVGIFSVLMNLGLDSIVVRELVKTPEKRDQLLGSTFMLKLAGFGVMLISIIISIALSDKDPQTNIIIAIIAVGYLFQTFQVLDFYYQAEVKGKYVAISQTTALLIVSAFRLYFAFKLYPLAYFAALESLFMLISFSMYAIFYMKCGNGLFSWKFKTSTAKMLLRESWPLLLSSAAGVIYMRIDQVMIKQMLGDAEVGYYAVAVRLVELWYFLPMIICSSLFPSIIRARNISEAHYSNRLKMLFSLMFWMGLIVSIGMCLAGKFIVTVLYGNEYAMSFNVLVIYAWNIIFCAMGVACGKWLLAEGLQMCSLYVALIGMVVNVICNFIFINIWGGTGAAFASLITHLFTGYFAYFIIGRCRRLFFLYSKAIIYPWNLKQ